MVHVFRSRLVMATLKPFVQADFLSALERADTSASRRLEAPLPGTLSALLLSPSGSGELTTTATSLVALLKAREATHRAAFQTELAADELRRYQKFAKPGQPSPHVVQMRQQQAAARQASSQARQGLNVAAATFVRQANITVPPRLAIDVFISEWIDRNVPTGFAPPTDSEA
jgi:hypothetical protein